jgi:hypothetical protein
LHSAAQYILRALSPVYGWEETSDKKTRLLMQPCWMSRNKIEMPMGAVVVVTVVNCVVVVIYGAALAIA